MLETDANTILHFKLRPKVPPAVNFQRTNLQTVHSIIKLTECLNQKKAIKQSSNYNYNYNIMYTQNT